MNTESLEEKLQKAVSTVQSEKENGKETDPLKAWLSSREPQVNPDALLALVEELKAQPGLSIFDGKMQVLENSRHRIDYGSLGNWLVFRALQVGTIKAIQDLERYLNNSEFEYHQILALSGITVKDQLQLANGIKLVPFSSIPNSILKVELSNLIIYGLHVIPRSALIRTLQHPRIHLDSEDESSKNTYNWRREFEDARLCLTLIGPSYSVGLGSWHTLADWVPCRIPGWSAASMTLNVVGSIGGPRLIDSTEYDRALKIHEHFINLDSTCQQQLRVALSRLNSALILSSRVDSAINLRTAMESIFLNDIGGDSGELSFRLRLRAARLLDQRIEKRKELFKFFGELYDLCSGAVHNGYIPKKYQKKEQEILEKGYKQVAKAIELIINNRGIDWNSIIFS
ncbi:MAG TPA: hypothetical protein VFF49_06400 [Thermodesulfobacteriota bacterium]|nr:hypothetical protein [Thermodesulfobacteriota bacterium]